MLALQKSFRRPFFVQPTIGTTFSDDFNRANEDPLDNGNWEIPLSANRVRLVSNRVSGISGVGNMAIVRTTTLQSWPDQEAEVEWRSGAVGVLLRIPSISNAGGYLLQIASTTLRVYALTDNGVGFSFIFTQIGATAIVGPLVAGDVVKFSAIGSTPVVLTGKLNGVEAFSYSDFTNHSISGVVGVYSQTTGGVLDNFSATLLGSPPPPYVPYFTYYRPGGVNTYYRPGGIEIYIRP